MALLFLGAIHVASAKDWVTYEGKGGAGKGKHIVFLSGDEEYRSEEGLPMLAKMLATRHGFKCSVLFSDLFPGRFESLLNGRGWINPLKTV